MNISTESGKKLSFNYGEILSEGKSDLPKSKDIIMKIVFFGTPNYVVPVLDAIHKAFNSKNGESPIAAVVTQPPKPTGRKQELEYSPIDTWAHKKKIPIFFDSIDLIKKQIHADIGILASYGAIIPTDVIKYFPYGILNIHPSLLPKWRGSSPVQATIVSGEEAGSTIIKIDEKLDHGLIISQFKDEVLPDDTSETLRARLFERSAEVLTTLIPAYLAGKVTPRQQDHKKASFTRTIKKEDAFIPTKYLNSALEGKLSKGKWNIDFIKINNKTYNLQPTSQNLHNFIRAMQPWPVAWTYVQLSTKNKEQSTKRLKILKSHLEPSLSSNYQLQSTKLVLDEIQLEGKSPVTWKQFLEGYPEAKFT